MSDSSRMCWTREQNEKGSSGAELTEQRLRHDLRQSLSTVMLLAQIADRQPLDGQVIDGTLEQMRHEVDWMRRVVAAPEGESELLVDAGEVVGEIWASIAHARPCSLRLVRQSGAWTWAHPVELGRAVRNLVENAVRAAGDGVVEVRVVRDDRDVVVEVHDSGPGFGMIRPQERLGLITVRRFAAGHDGRLVIDTSPLGGAMVRLVLPFVLPAWDDDTSYPGHDEARVQHRTTA